MKTQFAVFTSRIVGKHVLQQLKFSLALQNHAYTEHNATLLLKSTSFCCLSQKVMLNHRHHHVQSQVYSQWINCNLEDLHRKKQCAIQGSSWERIFPGHKLVSKQCTIEHFLETWLMTRLVLSHVFTCHHQLFFFNALCIKLRFDLTPRKLKLSLSSQET
jgi:hypothetical protein